MPKDVRSEILSQSSICVNWSAPVDKVNGFVIHYNDDNGMSMTQEVKDGDLLNSTLSNLNKGRTYTITVSSYIDLPSLPSDPIRIKLDGEPCMYVFQHSQIKMHIIVTFQFLIKLQWRMYY